MRSVCLVVKATYYNGLAGAYDHDAGCSARHPTEHDLEQDKHRVVAMESLLLLTSMLRPLLEIPQKMNFRLKIFFKDGSDYQKLEALRPVVRTFVDAGACVFLVSPAAGSDKDIKYNVRDYFDMSLQDWLNGYAAAAKARQREKNERIRKMRIQDAKEALGDAEDIDDVVLELRSYFQSVPYLRYMTELIARDEASEQQMSEFGEFVDCLESLASTSYPDDYSEDDATDAEGD